jgi:15-cis-phytoene synthase
MTAMQSPAPPLVREPPPRLDAEAIMRQRAHSFALAARLLPAPQRRPTTVLYALFRTLDDLVDEPPAGWGRARVAAELDAWEAWLRAELPPEGPSPLCLEVSAVVRRHAIPRAPLLAMIAGQRADLWHQPPADFAALERYCQQVASSVGEAMCYVLGAPTPATLAAARDLGVAMQLTNILRDVGEDLAAGRCYLPTDELVHFGCAPPWDDPPCDHHDGQTLHRQRVALVPVAWPREALMPLLAFQIQRARAYYRRGRRGVWLLPPAVRPAILLAARLYERILDCIERDGYEVFGRRAHTSRAEKALVIFGCAAELGGHRLREVIRNA